MYAPGTFSIDDEGEIVERIEAHPFASLVAAGDRGLVAAHAPVLVEHDQAGRPSALVGHLARANPFCDHVSDGAPVIAIFRGVDAYVSPSFYPSKREHGRVVPTWNYVAIEAEGVVTFTREAGALRGLVTRLTDRMEQFRPAPWAVTDAPETYTAALLDAIVGFRIAITSLNGKAKLSQNRPAADQAGVREGLSASPRFADQMLAAEMPREG